MKFTVLQQNFVKAYNQVSRVVGTRTTLPVLNNILISVERGKIKLSATDLEVAITSQVLGQVVEDGKITVPSRLLGDFISNNSDESIEVSAKDDNIIHLKSEHFRANINGISAEEFPTVPKMPKEHFCSINSGDFAEGLKRVVIATANDETRPVLAGVYFAFHKKKLVLAATDSFRLAEKKLVLAEEVEDQKFIAPSRTMTEILRLLTSGDPAAEVKITPTENQIAFKIGDVEVVSRLIEGAFPNYSQIIPASSKTTILVPKAELANAVKMSAFFTKSNAGSIQISSDEGKLVISTPASESGDATSELAAEITGGKVKISFNAKYVLDVLQVMAGNKVKMLLNDEASAGLIREESDESFLYIAMPLRVD